MAPLRVASVFNTEVRVVSVYNTEVRVVAVFNTEVRVVSVFNTEVRVVAVFNTEVRVVAVLNTEVRVVSVYNTEVRVVAEWWQGGHSAYYVNDVRCLVSCCLLCSTSSYSRHAQLLQFPTCFEFVTFCLADVFLLSLCNLILLCVCIRYLQSLLQVCILKAQNKTSDYISMNKYPVPV